MKIIYVDKKMKVIGRRNTVKRQMDWSGSLSIVITKAELTACLGPSVWSVYDSERHPSLKMRGGKLSSRRQLILRGIIKEDSFLREDDQMDKNRFINKKIDIDLTNYPGTPHQLGSIGGFSYFEGSGLDMSLYLPDDLL